MCGLAGYIDFQHPPEEKVLQSMGQAVAHRGPDEGRVWREGPCGLVHRRLRIIDLSPAAAQPMTNEEGRLWVVFNGEIYNHHPLREELLGLGHRFRSHSDTEVILHGYESWGHAVFRRLRGMFALALWDQQKSELILARDRLGKKPLFYATGPERIFFGSELPVFKCVPGFRLRVSAPAVREYVEFGYVQSPGSILEGVQRLPAGHFAIWGRSHFHLEPFWSLPLQPPVSRATGDSTQAAEALEGALRDAVACRLESDVPLGCFLSGGIDSSLVAAIAQQNLNGKLKTYTAGFENSAMNEAPYARRIAQHLGTQHHELMVSEKSLLGEFEEILALAPEPIGDDSFVPTHLISRETRQYVTVAISGDGGDELFAGYDKYRHFLAARRIQRWIPLPWSLVERLAPSDRYRKGAEALALRSPREMARWLSSLWKQRELPELLAPARHADAGQDRFTQCWDERQRYPELERWMLVDMETYLEGDILTKVDRASMAVGLETRSPFLDHQLIEQALQWPCHSDPVHGGKAILRKLLRQHVPEELFLRPKRGFGLPVEQWFRGALRPLLLRCTAPERIRQRGLFNPQLVQSAVEQHLQGTHNFARKLYALVAFEIWADRFFGQGVPLAEEFAGKSRGSSAVKTRRGPPEGRARVTDGFSVKWLAHLPAATRRTLYFGLQTPIGSRIRSTWREFQSWTRLSPDQLDHTVEQSLSRLLAHAGTHSEYYRRLGLERRASETAARFLQRFPVLTRTMARELFDDLLADSLRGQVSLVHTAAHKRYGWLLVKTGGTTGQPTTVLHDALGRDWGRATRLYAAQQCGFPLGTPYFRLWGSEADLLEQKSSLQQRVLSALLGEIRLNAFRAREADLRRHHQVMLSHPNIHHLMTYIDAAAGLAGFIQDHHLPRPRLKTVMACAGTVTPEYRRIVQETFQAEVFDKYGSRDCCDMACECGQHNGLHVFSPNVFLEIVDAGGQPCAAGQRGRILVTLLNNLSFPMIRYEVGDVGAWAESGPCPCGSPFPRLQSVQGRADDMLVTEDGTLQSSVFVRHFVGVSLNRELIQEWQLEQVERTRFVFRYIPRQTAGLAENLAQLGESFRRAFGATARIDLEQVADIPPSPTGKLRWIINSYRTGNVNRES